MLLTYLPGNFETDAAKWEGADMRETGWRVLPYGFSVLQDGSAIIFDREYRPICELSKAGVQLVDPTRQERWPGSWLFLYDDGATPRYCAETRRLQRVIVDRLGLSAELKRRAILQRNGKLPKSGGRMPQDELDMSMPWARELEDVVSNTQAFAFDGRVGRVMRLRPPPTAGAGWTPRPVTREDHKSAKLWLRSKGYKNVSVKLIARVIDVLGATRPRQMQIAA
ncbi:hypothetical protein [Rhizobium sp. OAE497]|uniref:hypothetical protein n=1 Tax=Rhizobium sp. OAE497 TaxID=2663796 RepID=UPI0018F4447A